MQYYLSRQSLRLFQSWFSISAFIEYQWQFSKVTRSAHHLQDPSSLSNRLVEFTLRLGSANPQCYGTSKTDHDRNAKAVLLLSSCSNGVHWTMIDRFRISDILAPDFGYVFSSILFVPTRFFRTINRILFEKTPMNNNNCMIEWRQMTHGGDNQDVWAIDDIIIREIPSAKSIKRNLHVKTYQTKSIYIRPGFILIFRIEPINRKEPITVFDLNDVGTILLEEFDRFDLENNLDSPSNKYQCD